MKIGILVGMENTFPPALIEKINGMDAGVTAEYVKIGGVKMGEVNNYQVIFDRISHEIPFYRSYLKNAVLNGSIVVNNPFWWSADEKFFGYSLATKLGLAIPKTVLLPQKAYIKGVTDASLRNLEFPLDWEAIIEHVGLPAILKPHDGGGWRDVYKVNSLEELWRDYDQTGTLAMTLQEFIDFTDYVRCYCVGKKDVLVMPYDPKNRRYLPQESLQHYAPEMLDRIKRDTILINEALGYDLNTVEFAIKDGVPYAIDFTNPAPDADIWSVTEPYFNWIIDKVANLLVDYAKNGKPTIGYHRWYRWLNHDATSEIASSAGELAQGLVSGVEQMAQKASNALSEVIDQITEPIKPKRTRKTSTEKDAKAEAKTAKGGKNAKNMKSGKK
ncbi:MAG: RimK family alpha-L-glutamate ligase [Blastocatellales bacterium]